MNPASTHPLARGIFLPVADGDLLGGPDRYYEIAPNFSLALSYPVLRGPGAVYRLGAADLAGGMVVNIRNGVLPAGTQKPQNAVAVNPEATIWTPAVGKRFRVLGWLLASSVVGNVVLRDNTAGTIIAVVPCGTAGVAVPSPDLGQGLLSAAVGNVLTATGPAASTLSGQVYGNEE